MNPQTIRRALDAYVARHARTPDVWPAVRRQVAPTLPASDRIHVGGMAGRGGLLLPIAVLLLVALGAFALAPGLRGALPPAGGYLAAATPTVKAPPAKPAAAADTAYGALLNRNLAARLGVDEPRLNAAFAAAVADTADQAVRDGKLSADGAAKLKETAQGGLGNMLPLFMDTVQSAGAAGMVVTDDKVGVLLKSALAALPDALKMSAADVDAALSAGQSPASLAQAHGVSLDTLRAALLAAARQAAGAQVAAHTWTQAEADTAYQSLTGMLDAVLQSPGNLTVTTGAGDTLTITGSGGAGTVIVNGGVVTSTMALPGSDGALPLPPAGGAVITGTVQVASDAPYGALLNRNLATHLGVDEAKLNTAFAAAVADTTDQAVRDGKISPETAAGFNAAAQNGPGPLLALFADTSRGASAVTVADPRVADLIKSAFAALPDALGLKAADVDAALTAGQSPADLAEAHGVSLDTLRTALLAAARTTADAQVAARTWTQAQADTAMQELSGMLDMLLQSPGKMEVTTGGDGSTVVVTGGGVFTSTMTVPGSNAPAPIGGATTGGGAGSAGGTGLGVLKAAAFAAGAQALGMTPQSFTDALAQGQAAAALAQAHHSSAGALRTTMLTAARQTADAQVSRGAWTQQEADDAYTAVEKLITELFAAP